MKVLLTGFNPFGILKINPSEEIVKATARRLTPSSGIDLTAEVLPTEYSAAEDRIHKLIRESKPDAVLCLGLSEILGEMKLERIALNIDDAPFADNADEVRSGTRIAPEGPLAYESTLPMNEMLEALRTKNVPASFSNHAGTFVCNHVFYSALHEVNKSAGKIKCGFIHVPLMVEQLSKRESVNRGLPLNTMIAAIESCLMVLSKRPSRSVSRKR